MFHQIYAVFLFLFFLCCQLCELTCAAQDEQLSGNIKENTFSGFLKPKDEKLSEAIAEATGFEKEQITVTLIDSVFIAAANGIVVALAEVDYSSNSDKKFILLEKFIETDKEKWKNGVVKYAFNDWKTELVTKNDKNIKNKAKFKSSAVVASGNKIYYFSVNNTTFDNSPDALETDDNPKWHITIVLGDFATGKRETRRWNLLNSNTLLKSINLKEKLKTDPGNLPPAVGSGFVIGDKIVFAIQGEGEGSNKNKNVTLFFQFDEQTKDLKFLNAHITENCHPSLFLWKEQIVITPTVCATGGDKNMIMFDSNTNKFDNSKRPIARLQEFLNDKKNFVTTKIDEKTEVLLFTQQTKESEKPEVYLWVTDGNRTAKVDAIITGEQNNFDLSVLHIKNELFVLYNNYETGGSDNEGKSTYNLKRLPESLAKINSILNAWKITNNKIRELFIENAFTETSLFTDRLVGFLSDNGESNKYWNDEYFYKTVTVTNGKKVSKGFTFSDAGAGAEWTLGNKNSDQPYDFADPGFTLVATVKLDKVTNEKISVLGVVLEKSDKKNSIGLWCSKENWSVGDNKNPTKTLSAAGKCVQGETYYVTLIFKKENKKLLVYIDWKQMKEVSENIIDLQQQENIKHFYFGADNDADKSSVVSSHVTVTNVLLYNQPFESEEIENFKKYIKPIEKIKTLQNNNKNTTGSSDQQIPTQLPLSTTGEERKEETPSPSRTADGCVGCGSGVRVFSLLLAVLCVSAPLLHL